MTTPQWNSQISLGNVLTIGAMVLAAGIAWGVMQQTQDTVNVRMARIEQEWQRQIDAGRADAAAKEARLRVLETEQAVLRASMVEKLSSIEATLSRLERIVTASAGDGR
jgi:hypothetical protein